jgi:hypothetical protein
MHSIEDVLALTEEDYKSKLLDLHLFPLSKSKVSSYKFCPYQFALRYIKKVPSEQNFKMVIGIRYHHFMENFFDYIDEVDDWTKLIHEDYTPFERGLLSWTISMEYARYAIYSDAGHEDLYKPFIREVDFYNTPLDVHGIIDRSDYLIPELIPYMEGEISNREKNGILKKLAAGKKLLCITEYKTGDSFFEKGLKEEVSLYKQCFLGDPRYSDYEVGCGCVINPKLKKIHYLGLERDETTKAKIETVKENIRQRIFPKTCSPGKYEACKLCEFNETGL